MDCHHYAAGRCRSCTLLEVPRPRQVADKEEHARSLVSSQVWLPTFCGPEAGFRNKAKMAVGGSVDHPTLGILDGQWRGVDLRDCALHEPVLTDALAVLAQFVARAGLTPYDVAGRQGELKHVLLTASPSGELLARLVMRSTALEARVRKHLPWLLESLPALRVVTLNVQPDHKAVLEGEREVVLTEDSTLPMALATGVRLHLGPRAFFQTNTVVAESLYSQARSWVDGIAGSGGSRPGVDSVWDLYCGVGGFALHLADGHRDVLGVEVSAEAIDSARRSADELGLGGLRFESADASAYVVDGRAGTAPDLVVVNPPRRGIGPELAGWLERSDASYVIYSSCNAVSLAKDLAAMPSWQVSEARVLDMFPHTSHYEVITLLRKRP